MVDSTIKVIESIGELTVNNDAAETIETPDWLNQDLFVNIIKNQIKNFKEIKKFQVVAAVKTGENYMAILRRVLFELELKDATTVKTSFIIKMQHSSEELLSMIKTWRVFEKEQHTYGTLIPEFEAYYRKAGREVRFGPKVFDIKKPELTDDVILMEDLRLKGFQNVKRQIGLDMLHTQAVLEKLAQFHAASAVYYEAHGTYSTMYNQSLCSEEDLFVEYRDNISKLFRDCLELYVHSDDIADFEEKLKTYSSQAPDQFQAISPLNSNEFNVLNHGDCWSNNIMFQYDDSNDNAKKIIDTYFVDFQMSRYGSPAHDLYYVLLPSASLDIKFKYFDYFIYFYHQKLIENLKLLKYTRPFPTLANLHISMLRHGDWVYTIITALLPVVLLDSIDDASAENLMSAEESGSDLKKAMFKNPRYAEHMQQILPWMVNRGLLEYVELKAQEIEK